MNKIICIGDCHGMINDLKNLFSKLSLTKNDTLIFLGDYIDRGKESRAVVDFVIGLREKYRVVTLAGNHEQFFLDSLKCFEGMFSYRDMYSSWLRNGGIQTLRSYAPTETHRNHFPAALNIMNETHGEFFRCLVPFYETETHIFVHGGINMNLPLEEQDEFYCLWSRFDDMKAPHISGKTVVCGHTIQHGGPNDQGFKVCIDTGSFRSDGYITAMIIEGDKVSYLDSK